MKMSWEKNSFKTHNKLGLKNSHLKKGRKRQIDKKEAMADMRAPSQDTGKLRMENLKRQRDTASGDSNKRNMLGGAGK